VVPGGSYDIKEEVRSATDIVELVGRYVSLHREGANFTGICPWHNDRRPSLKVSPQRQSYRCFVCGEGGDCFSFVMKIEGITFPEAVDMLADAAGIAPPSRRSASGEEKPESPRKKQYAALRWAEDLYHRCLIESPAAQPARDYLARRGVSDESIGRFHIGFAPNQWNWLAEQRLPEGVTPQMLHDVGLRGTSREGGKPFHRFKGRLTFSIRDPQGRTIGFGGRLVPGVDVKSEAKYVNSPETPLFVKSRVLYGLDVAREAIRRSGFAIIVEGYTDVISLHEYGFENTVAVLGTALGVDHVRLLKRFQANRAVLLLDGDEAGQRRSEDLLELFLDSDIDVRIATLPAGLDPCDLVQQQGTEALETTLEEAVDALEHRFRSASRNLDPEDTHAAHQAAERVLGTLAKARSAANPAALRIRLDQILFRLARRTGISQARLEQRLDELRREIAKRTPSRESAAEPASGSPPRIPWREQELIEIILLEPESVAALAEAIRPAQLQNAGCRFIYETACQITDSGRAATLDSLMLEIDDPQVKRQLVELDEHAHEKANVANPAQRATAVMEMFLRQNARTEHRSTIEAIKKKGNEEEEQLQMLDRLVRSARDRQGTSGPTDG